MHVCSTQVTTLTKVMFVSSAEQLVFVLLGLKAFHLMSWSWRFWQMLNVRGLGRFPISLTAKRHFCVCVCMKWVPPSHCGSHGNEYHVLVCVFSLFLSPPPALSVAYFLIASSCFISLRFAQWLLCVCVLSFLVLTLTGYSDCEMN